MKKYLICALFGVFFGVMFFTACDEPSVTEHESVPHDTYTTYGTYYTNGEIITDDGNIWDYSAENIADETPIVVVFDDMGTNNIYDDEILEIVER